jgi:hypothetical protein
VAVGLIVNTLEASLGTEENRGGAKEERKA